MDGGIHCKKRLAVFPSPAGMLLTKLSLAGNNLVIPGQKEFGIRNVPAGGRKINKLFLQCSGRTRFHERVRKLSLIGSWTLLLSV